MAFKQRGLAGARVPGRGLRRAALPGGGPDDRRRTLERRRERLRQALRGIEAGLQDALARPDAAVGQIAAAAETRDVGLIRAQLDAVRPAFAPGLRLERGVVEQWADFDARIGIVDRRPDVRRAFDFTLVDG